MKFTVNNKTYFVKWQYAKEAKMAYIKGMPTWVEVDTTVCKIYDNSSSYTEPLIEASCTVAVGDKFNKNTGRKISLDRALHKLFPDDTLFVGTPNKFDGYDWKEEHNLDHKKAREIAWKEYFNESPKRLK